MFCATHQHAFVSVCSDCVVGARKSALLRADLLELLRDCGGPLPAEADLMKLTDNALREAIRRVLAIGRRQVREA